MVFVRLLGLVLCLVNGLLIGADNLVANVQLLRTQQRTAGWWQYRALEQEIRVLKQEHGNHQQWRETERFYFLRSMSHLLPFIVWQFLCLGLLFFVAVFLIRKRTWYSFMVVVMSIVCGLFSYMRDEERVEKWLILNKNEALYAGPGSAYPQLQPLTYLDEVKIIQKNDAWCHIQQGTNEGWIECD